MRLCRRHVHCGYTSCRGTTAFLMLSKFTATHEQVTRSVPSRQPNDTQNSYINTRANTDLMSRHSQLRKEMNLNKRMKSGGWVSSITLSLIRYAFSECSAILCYVIDVNSVCGGGGELCMRYSVSHRYDVHRSTLTNFLTESHHSDWMSLASHHRLS